MSLAPSMILRGRGNYHIWAYALTHFLKSRQLWYCIDPNEEFPIHSERYDNHDHTALSIILRHMNEDQIALVLDLHSSQSVWNRLASLYGSPESNHIDSEQAKSVQIWQLIEKIETLKKSSETVILKAEKIRNICFQIEAINSQQQLPLQITLLLLFNSVGPEYTIMIDVLKKNPRLRSWKSYINELEAFEMNFTSLREQLSKGQMKNVVASSKSRNKDSPTSSKVSKNQG